MLPNPFEQMKNNFEEGDWAGEIVNSSVVFK